jgi:hypothetical protein
MDYHDTTHARWIGTEKIITIEVGFCEPSIEWLVLTLLKTRSKDKGQWRQLKTDIGRS